MKTYENRFRFDGKSIQHFWITSPSGDLLDYSYANGILEEHLEEVVPADEAEEWLKTQLEDQVDDDELFTESVWVDGVMVLGVEMPAWVSVDEVLALASRTTGPEPCWFNKLSEEA